MRLFCKISIYGPVPSDIALSQREWNRLKALAWTLVGQYWHEKLRPKHFTKAGAQEYHYQPRSGEPGTAKSDDFWHSYAGSKQKKFGENLPLVYTGETRALSEEKNIIANGNGVRITYDSLRKLNQYKPKSGIDLRADFQAVSPEEEEILQELWVHQMENLLRGFRGGGVKTIGNTGG
jgi:hypothetical protein